MREIDINCDMGESFGRWRLGDDEAIMPLVSTVSVACGYHAGDAVTMVRTARAAAAHGLAIGAHPGLPDLVGFGRRQMEITPEEAYAYVLVQAGALRAALASIGEPLRHVKLHGAFPVLVAHDEALATAVIQAVVDVLDAPRMLYPAFPRPNMLTAVAERHGVELIRELYPDLEYGPDGSLAPPVSGHFGSAEHAQRQVVRALRDGQVAASDGSLLPLAFDSICVHGDGPDAVATVREIRRAIEEAGHTVRTPTTRRSR